jgi:fructose-1,6-bisphosphatase/sedoheptulose 1,7-bisphosphatase-like protein
LLNEARSKLVTERNAIGREPVIGKGERAAEIGGTSACDAVDASLNRITATAPEVIGESPVGPTAASAKPAAVSGVK